MMFVALVTPCRGNACSVCTRVQCLTLPFFHDSFFMLEEKKMKIANPSKKKPRERKHQHSCCLEDPTPAVSSSGDLGSACKPLNSMASAIGSFLVLTLRSEAWSLSIANGCMSESSGLLAEVRVARP